MRREMLRTGALRQVAMAVNLSPLTAPASPAPADPVDVIASEFVVRPADSDSTNVHSMKGHTA